MNADPKRMTLYLSVFIGVHLWLNPFAALAAEPAPGSVLHLTNGGFVAGELRGSADAKLLQWHSPQFARPLEFPLAAVKGVLPSDMARATSANFFRLFDKIPVPAGFALAA